MYHPYGTDRDVKRGHHRVDTSNHHPEDMGALQYFLSPSPFQAEESGKNLRKGGIHHSGTKYILCTASPYRIASRGDQSH